MIVVSMCLSFDFSFANIVLVTVKTPPFTLLYFCGIECHSHHQVGLAVDDIKGILEEAALTRLALRVRSCTCVGI